MNKFVKTLLGGVCALSMLFGAACDGLGDLINGNGGDDKNFQPSENDMASEEVEAMKGSITETAGYAGSYTIHEDSVSQVYMAGSLQGGSSMTADVAYDAASGNFYYGADLTAQGKGNVLVYNKKNADNSYVQYSNLNGSPSGQYYASESALISQGLKTGNSSAFHMTSLKDAIKKIFLVDLAHASTITSASKYAAYFSGVYKSLGDQVTTPLGVTATYKNGGSASTTVGDTTSYTFDILCDISGTPTAQGYTLTNYVMEMAVTISVTGDLLTSISANITQNYTLMGYSCTSISTVTDSFSYSYNSALTPSVDGWTVTGLPSA